MREIRDRVAGLDVHRDTVVACCRVRDPDGRVELSKRSFATTRKGLGELAAFLSEHAVQTVAMEATGVYWFTGVSRTTAEVIVAETGAHMSRFPSAGHLCAWAGLAPASYESAGKRRPAGTRHGTPWLRRTLVEAARAGARTKSSYHSAQYARIARRRGPNKAAVAVAHSMLEVVWHPLTTGALYDDPGADYFKQRHDPLLEARRLTRRIEAFGFDVSIHQKAASPAPPRPATQHQPAPQPPEPTTHFRAPSNTSKAVAFHPRTVLDGRRCSGEHPHHLLQPHHQPQWRKRDQRNAKGGRDGVITHGATAGGTGTFRAAIGA